MASELTQRKRAQTVVALAEAADGLAIATDGPVPPTWEVMSKAELRRFFRTSYLLAKGVLDGE